MTSKCKGNMVSFSPNMLNQICQPKFPSTHCPFHHPKIREWVSLIRAQSLKPISLYQFVMIFYVIWNKPIKLCPPFDFGNKGQQLEYFLVCLMFSFQLFWTDKCQFFLWILVNVSLDIGSRKRKWSYTNDKFFTLIWS